MLLVGLQREGTLQYDRSFISSGRFDRGFSTYALVLFLQSARWIRLIFFFSTLFCAVSNAVTAVNSMSCVLLTTSVGVLMWLSRGGVVSARQY